MPLKVLRYKCCPVTPLTPPGPWNYPSHFHDPPTVARKYPVVRTTHPPPHSIPPSYTRTSDVPKKLPNESTCTFVHAIRLLAKGGEDWCSRQEPEALRFRGLEDCGITPAGSHSALLGAASLYNGNRIPNTDVSTCMIATYTRSLSHLNASMEKKALSGSCTRALGRSAQCNVDCVSGPEVRVTHSLLIPVLVYTGKFVPSGLVSGFAFRRSFIFPVICTVVQNAFGFSERR